MPKNEDAPGWVIPAMRLGYTARGVTYLIIGVLAALAAWTGGEAQGTSDALASLESYPMGVVALWAIALGMLCYAVWRLICAGYDLEDHGSGAKAAVARMGQAVTGLIHLGIAFSVARLAWGFSGGEGGGQGGEGGSGAQSVASWVLSLPYGSAIIMAIGAITIGAGIYYGWKGISEKYKENMRYTEFARKLDPVVKAGLIAHGVIIAIIGVFLIYAGLYTDPGQAGGIGKAFQEVRSQPYGMVLLGALALGTVAFAVYCWIEAAYRVVPRCAGPDIRTLADRAKAEARGLTG